MSKAKKSIKIRLPEYVTPRNDWRKEIHRVFATKWETSNITYSKADKLELIIKLYLDKGRLEAHDVDNRLKDIMDALQGRIGGPKNVHKYRKYILNDNQVYKVTIEKQPPRNYTIRLGHLIVRKYKR
ncbi:MAG TPA: hypothetical protein DEE98_03540 [Elusimicrobia bacterium]|nr:MAG: hypothetical protein A2278_02605 [Elusimicrobia bacterium RIFOXYA12_FULL_49_49]OGS08811.1 MAG: hypothetical protein A2204_08310 [Elusimicrobia bacterium RIFOXYA1_FULL_47_7]OGS10288.1 MAG: hypothetical protein A2386_08085 [Elusimicrobia bacterium RIFOXYB1_FULL_48_9]OGS16374.1 MAG: hypothetical protein A2251_06060 [Elusimicrobia bacterium RIFOXYA2_FULL_47_53]OGS27249.1 MAG: hypothetical protein A2339_08120 [Elusimicrobia bacterium RIFOXYB12_FULL_50_12]OGS30449.1 MAG: hypothetical protein